MQKGRISVRRELREPDAFMKTVSRVLEYLQKHRQQALFTAALLVTLLAAAAGTSWYLHDRRIKAEQALNQVLATLDSRDPAEAGKLLEQVRQDFSGSAVGVLAGYLEANYRYRQGQFEQAVRIYSSNPSDDRHLEDLQKLGVAAARYRQKNYSGAITLLEELQSRQSFINENVYILLGLCYEKAGEPEKARATFENMIQLLPGTIFKSWAEEQLVRLRKAPPAKS